MKTIFAVLLGTLMFSASQANAQDSGCGLGTMIFKQNTKVFQLLAMTTNDTTFTQILGITTGTSGCRASSIVMREREVQYFAEVNKDDLSREMAQGEGEKLTTLASLYGCTGEARTDFARMTQSSFARIVPNAETTAVEMVNNLNQEFISNATLTNKCQSI